MADFIELITERLRQKDSITSELIEGFNDWVDENEFDHEALIDDIKDPAESFLFDLCKDDFKDETLFDIFAEIINSQENPEEQKEKPNVEHEHDISINEEQHAGNDDKPIEEDNQNDTEEKMKDNNTKINTTGPNQLTITESVTNEEPFGANDEKESEEIDNQENPKDQTEKPNDHSINEEPEEKDIFEMADDEKKPAPRKLDRSDEIKEEICEAENVLNCPKLPNLIKVLHLYNKIQEELLKDLSIVMDTMREYPTIESDFAHIQGEHLYKGDDSENSAEFDDLFKILKRKIACELKDCGNWKRNNRDRGEDKYTIDQIAACSYRDSLDSIHCFLLHSYETGYRFKTDSDSKTEDSYIVDECNDDEKIKQTQIDVNFQKLAQSATDKRKKLKEIGGSDRFEFSKFNNEVDDNVDGKEKKDDDNDGDDNKQAIAIPTEPEAKKSEGGTATDEDQIMYSYGFRCYYWLYYKNNEDEDVYYHPTQSYAQWYVGPKFRNLKEEAFNNPFVVLTEYQWQGALQKAKKFIKIDQITKMISKSKILDDHASQCDTELHYDIKDRSAMQIQHLVTLVCYTDFTDFSYQFSKSFRKVSSRETDDQMKERHSNYHHLAKAIRELVELFGTTMDKSKTKHYFTGISIKVNFPSFVARFCCPTSTTTQMAVATVFAKQEGVILTLTKNVKSGEGLRFFNVAYLSAYKEEEERLFVGGRQCINVFNIRTMADGNNYINYVLPIQKFEAVLSQSLGQDTEIKKFDFRVVRHLLDHYLGEKDNEFPEYMNKIFKAVVESKRSVSMNVDLDGQSAKHFSSLLMSEECDNFARIDYISQFMPKLEYIILQKYSTCLEFMIGNDFLKLMAKALASLEPSCKLKEIKVLNYRKSYGQTVCQQFEDQIGQIQWEMTNHRVKQGYKNQNIAVLMFKKRT